MAKRNTAWKTAERRLAEFFNTKRRALSGALWSFTHVRTKSDRGDDAQHDRLYIESKYGDQYPVVKHIWDLYKDTRDKRDAEGFKDKLLVVLGLQKSSQPGILIVVHSSEMEALSKEYLTQLGYKIEGSNDDKVSKSTGKRVRKPVEGLSEVPAVREENSRSPVPRLNSRKGVVHRRGSRT